MGIKTCERENEQEERKADVAEEGVAEEWSSGGGGEEGKEKMEQDGGVGGLRAHETLRDVGL